jgi:hypothetical protein
MEEGVVLGGINHDKSDKLRLKVNTGLLNFGLVLAACERKASRISQT